MSLRNRLGRARGALATRLAVVRGRDEVDAVTWDRLEEALILADVGVATSAALLARVSERAAVEGASGGDGVVELLKDEIVGRLDRADRTLSVGGAPSVWLFVGVNGVGKTTTIGKVGRRLVAEGRQVVFAAGDTYRYALDAVVVPVVERFAPDWLLVSAGFDAHRSDPLTQLGLTAGDFADLTARLVGMVPTGRSILFLEGGYDLESLAAASGAAVAAAVGVDFRPEAASGEGPGREAVDEAAVLHGLVER